MAVYKLTVRLAHTTGTYVPCSLYRHPKYNDTAHDTGAETIRTESSNHEQIDCMVSVTGGVG
jgi:hypothetical protein